MSLHFDKPLWFAPLGKWLNLMYFGAKQQPGAPTLQPAPAERQTGGMKQTILVVDDKSNVRVLLSEYLTEQGFRVVTADNGRTALYAARHEEPALILLDIMMPEMNGYQFLEQYRKERTTPVIVITARDDETDAVQGLELGADDYIIKPFRMKELEARIRAVLRRAGLTVSAPPPLRMGALTLNPAAHEVTMNGQPVELTPIEFYLLQILMESAGQVIPRERLFDRMMDHGYTGTDKTINVHIRNLRAKIEPDPADPLYIETVFGVGYRFAPPE